MTVNWIIHGGQTGVDRGAWAAGKLLEKAGSTIKVGGIMPYNMCDEHGVIPPGVREHMRACELKGYDARTKENVLLASALLVIVEDRLNPERTPGTKLTLSLASRRPGLQVMVASSGDEAAITSWLVHLPPSVRLQSSSRSSDFFLVVAGPRASLWPQGESVACDLLYGALKP